MNRQISIIGIMMICLVIQASTAFAWGVVHENNHITMLKGESREFYTSLQNMVGDTNYTVAVELVHGSDIATIQTTENLDLPMNTRKLPVYIQLSIPNETEQESYRVTIKYKLTSSEQGQVSLGQEKIININIEIVEPPPEPEPEPEPPTPPPSTGGTVGGDSHGTGGTFIAPSEPEQPDQPSEPVEPDNGKPVQPVQPDQPVEPEHEDTLELDTGGDVVGQIITQPINIFSEQWFWVVIVVIISGIVGYMLMPRKEEHDEMIPVPYQSKYAPHASEVGNRGEAL